MFNRIKGWFYPQFASSQGFVRERDTERLAEDFTEDPRAIVEDLISAARQTPPVSTRETGTTGGATMSSIRETIIDALNNDGMSHYASHGAVVEVIDRLEEREEEGKAHIADALRQLAHQKGMNDAEIEESLILVDLVDRPEPEAAAPAAVEVSDLAAQVADLVRQVSALTEAAQRAGVRV